MSATRTKDSPRFPRRAARAVLAAAVFCPALFYLVQAWIQGRIIIVQGSLNLETAEFYWSWLPSPRLALAGLFAAGFLAFVLWPARREPGRFGLPALAASILLILAATALALMQPLGARQMEPSLWLFTLLFGGLITWLLYRPRGPRRPGAGPSPAARLAAWAARAASGPALPLAAAVAGAALMIAGWLFIFDGQPIITDSQSQIAQARLLLAGHWRLEVSQPLRDVICFPYGTRSVPSFSQYPPGYIFPLAAALALRLPPQAVDILTAALMAGAVALIARRVSGRAGAVAATLLLLGSPFFLALSGSGMNHSLCAALLAVAALCFLAPARPRLALLGGFCLGWVAMTRPVTALAHAAVWGSYWIMQCVIDRMRNAECGMRNAELGVQIENPRTTHHARRTTISLPAEATCSPLGFHSAFRIPHSAFLLFGLAIPAAILLYYNYRTTGHPFVLGYQVSNPALHRLGFHGGPLPYTPADAWHRLAANLLSLDAELFGWVTGSWLLLVLWFLRSPLRRGERALLALIFVQTGLYTLYQYHDLYLGPRFLYELLPAFAVLGGAALAPTLRRGGARAGTLLALLAILTLGALGGGFREWSHRLGVVVIRHRELDRAIRAAYPLREPTVIVLENRAQGEMIGRHFASDRLWFVARQDEPAARRLPELAGYRWVPLQDLIKK